MPGKYTDETYNTARAVDSTHPDLHFIEHDMCDITGRLIDIDDGYFVMYNLRKSMFEVHNAHNLGGDTYCLTTCDRLDARTISMTEKTRSSTRGDRILKDLKKSYDKYYARQERDTENDLDAMSRDLASDLSLAVQKDELYDGYKRTHVIEGLPV